MIDKRRFYSFLVIGILSVGLILTTLFLPIVNVISKSMMTEAVIAEASGTFSLISFTRAMFYMVDACYTASGPVWLSILGVLLNWIVVFDLICLLVVIILELSTFKKQEMLFKRNNIAKKLSLFVGFLAFSVFIFEFVSFMITTMLSNGYFVYSADLQVFVTLTISLLIVICAYISGRKNQDVQSQNKIRDVICLTMSFISAVIMLILIFIPITPEGFSLWNISSFANDIGEDPYMASIFIGLSQWATIFMGIVIAFIFIYCIVAVVRSLKNKSINWLSLRTKRWSLSLAILSHIYFSLMIVGVITIYGGFVIDGVWTISPIIILMPILSLLPHIFSLTLPYNRKSKAVD